MRNSDAHPALRWLLPDGIIARFALLLVALLLVGNIIAALLLAREGTSFDRQIRIEVDLGRLVSLVTALEQVDGPTARTILRQSGTGYTRFAIADEPLVPPETRPDPGIVEVISRALPGYHIRAVTGEAEGAVAERPVLFMVSVQLTRGQHADKWLTSLVYPLRSAVAWKMKGTFFVPLVISLVATFIAGILSVSKMTRPLRELAQAARVAGHGDRSVRVAEVGAREIRDAATAFNDMQRRIENQDKEQMRLVAAIGHDLRTPITGLRIRTEMLEDTVASAPMLDILDTMTVMADDLLHFGTTNRGGEAMQRLDMALVLGPLCARPGVRLALPAGPVMATVRRVEISRAIGNLIENALRYAGTAAVSLSVPGGEVVVAVEDDGPGIEPHRLDEIVEPFVRGENSRSKATGGVGLGLAIARSIATGHGGALVLSARVGGGLRAEIRIPADAG